MMVPCFVIGLVYPLLLATPTTQFSLDPKWNQNAVFSRWSSLTLLISNPTPSLVKTGLSRPPHFFASSLSYACHKLLLVLTTPSALSFSTVLQQVVPGCPTFTFGQMPKTVLYQCCPTCIRSTFPSRDLEFQTVSTVRKSRSRCIPGSGIKNTSVEKFSRLHLYWKVKPKGHLFTIVSILLKREKYFLLLLFSKAFDLNRAIATTSFKFQSSFVDFHTQIDYISSFAHFI